MELFSIKIRCTFQLVSTFLDKEKHIEWVSFHVPTVFRCTKVGNHARFLDTQNIANQREAILFGGDLHSTYFAPPFGTPAIVIFCRFLRPAGKQKLPISFGNQEFAVNCFSSKWCHQESNLLLRFILTPWVTAHFLLYLLWKPLNWPYAKFIVFLY